MTRRMRRGWLYAVVVVSLGLVVDHAAAAAPKVVLKPLLRAVAHGADHDYALRLDVATAPGALCRGHVTAGRATVQLPALNTAAYGSGTWTWYVPTGAPRGQWIFTVGCRSVLHSSTGQIRLRGVAPRRGRATRRLATRVHAIAQPVGFARGVGYGASAVNIYPWGECTWYAFSRRADLVVNYGNAADWFGSAQRRGVPTGTTPVAGAVAVFQPGVDSAGGYGHVAYVESVSGDTMHISEWNFVHHHQGPSYRDVNWRSTLGQTLNRAPALGFIYGGPAGSGPGTAPTAPLPPPPDNMLPKANPAPAPTATAASYPYHVQGTCADGACGLHARSLPSYSDPASTVVGGRYDGDEVDIVCQTRGENVTGRSGRSSTVWDKLTDGSYVTDYYVNTPNVDQFTPPIPQCGSAPPPAPAPAPAPPPPPPTFAEQETPRHPVNTFANYHNASGQGPAIAAGQIVQVSCKVLDGTIVSVNPDGYWYRVASSPWNGQYYAPANTFLDGDPPNGPYTHNTDFAVPDC